MSNRNDTTDPVSDYVYEEQPPDGPVFEIGLVLAGAISAGSFSAGVMDFLIEALDAWEAAKRDSAQSVPKHEVRLRVVAGASAGSMNGAIAAVALQYDFTHVGPSTPVNNYTNPFYESWVKRIDIKYLLAGKDLVASTDLHSLLDSTVLDEITRDALNAAGKEKQRPYLDGRVRFVFSQGGLRGIPYYVSMNGPSNGGLEMTLHKTYRSFAIDYGGKAYARRPDDMRLDAMLAMKASTSGWSELGNAALGSGAFPLGLAPRFESRNPVDLDYRFVNIPDDVTGKLTCRQIKPSWTQTFDGVSQEAPNPYNEFVVDGGTMDNEPLDMARTELAGLIGFNTRNGEHAKRGIVMIDPFPDEPPNPADYGGTPAINVLTSALGLIGAWKSQARFSPVDVALAADKDTYSRYLIAPRRADNDSAAEKESRGFHIASGALGGFGGFLSEEYRRHDYLLGRRNCQQFLAQYFSLPAINHIFDGIDRAVLDAWKNKDGEIPIIPLVGKLGTTVERLPGWPRQPVDLRLLRNSLGKRFGLVVESAIDASGYRFGWVKRIVARWAIDGLSDFALQKIMAIIEGELSKRNLKTTR